MNHELTVEAFLLGLGLVSLEATVFVFVDLDEGFCGVVGGVLDTSYNNYIQILNHLLIFLGIELVKGMTLPL